MEGSDVEEGEDGEDQATFWELLTRFYEETKRYKKFFNLNDFAEGFLFKFFLPLHDIVSDFLIAKNFSTIKVSWFKFFAYDFIACPGFMIFFYQHWKINR